MSTLADELLNDFEDSGSDGGEEGQDGFLQNGQSPPATNGHAHAPEGSMILDGDEEEMDDDEDMDAGSAQAPAADVEDEEEAKAKVEKMQLGGVNDVRSVAGLMKTLEPVLQVCEILSSHCFCGRARFTSCVDVALTFLVTSRKSPTTKIFHLVPKPYSSVRLKTIRNITFSLNQIPSPPRSTTRLSLYISSFATTTQPVFLNWRLLSQTLSTMRGQSLS